MTEQEYKKAVETLNKWAYAYYTLDNPIATDEEYDKLYFQVVDYEKNNPIDPLSPTQRVGDRLAEGFQTLKHKEKMYSLDDVFDEEEFLEWGRKIEKELNKKIDLYVEPKFDGASLNLLYEDGVLSKAITRGDGEKGEDITANAPYINGIPLAIDLKDAIEIRGEVVIFKEDLDKVNELREKQGKEPFLNPRNGASGALRTLDSISVKNAHLRFIPYGVGANSLNLSSLSAIMNKIHELGFINHDKHLKTSEIMDLGDSLKAYKQIHNDRDIFKMMLDGVVVKVNSLEDQKKLGFTSKFPKWAIAFKFPAVEKTTTLLDVTWQTGKTGIITPVAELKPVEIDGVTVSRATLHNISEIQKKDFRIGDQVVVIRSGDVIPKVLKSFTDRRTGKEIAISTPENCPSCGGDISITKNGITECQNDNCIAKQKGRIISAISRKGLDLKGLGDSIVEQLVDLNIINNVADIFSLKRDDLVKLDGFKDKKIQNTLTEIRQRAELVELYRWIYSLQIPLIGEKASKLIANNLGDKFAEETINISKEELLEIEGIGEIMAENFVKFLDTNKDFIENYKTKVIILRPSTTNKKDHEITGKTFVITGSLSLPRKYYAEQIEKLGGIVSNSVSKKTDYLLAGEKAGSKLSKALELRVPVLNEEEFSILLQ